MTFFIVLFILLMQFIWKYVDDLVGKGLEWYIVLELLFYASWTFIPLALPLAILLSSLMTFGNLGERYELVAMKSAGISFRKAMQPLVILSVIISLGAFYFSTNILPVVNLKFHSILYDVRHQKLALNIKEGVFYHGIDGFVIKVGKKEKDGNHLEDIMIYNHTERKGNIDLTIAKSGRMELTPDERYLIFTLYDGTNYETKLGKKDYRLTRPFQRTKFKEEYRKFDLSIFAMQRTNEDLFKHNYQMLNLRLLEKSIDSLYVALQKKQDDFISSIIKTHRYLPDADTVKEVDNDIDSLAAGVDILNYEDKIQQSRIISKALSNTRGIKRNLDFHKKDIKLKKRVLLKHKIQWHRKFTLSFACLVLFFIGAPLGAIIRKGGLGLPMVISVLFFILFHFLTIMGEKFSREGVLPPYKGMWIASAVLLPIGIFLTFKATTDSPLLDADNWRKIFKKLFFRKR
jgi:lipopolysaccharide export system permease protein